jgi:Domain of unknown function (DUF4157)
MEKTVLTLGERLAVDGQRLLRRYHLPPPWLELLEPVTAKAEARTAAAARFDRREGVPRQPAAPPPLPLEAPGEPLDADLQDRLRPLIGPDTQRARLHTDEAADALARSHRADAVTVGTDVHFRAGAFRPDTPAGLGLLAHELTHVAESVRPGVGWRRATEQGRGEEERLAVSHEHSVLRPAAPPIAPAGGLPLRSPLAAAVPAPRPAVAPSSGVGAPQLRPMAAETDRPAVAATVDQPDLDQLRNMLYRDIMARIRVDFERGA